MNPWAQPLWGRLRARRISPQKTLICGCGPIANPAWQDNDSLFSWAGVGMTSVCERMERPRQSARPLTRLFLRRAR